VIAFDVNETLLDLRALDDPFERVFGTAALRPQWFAPMLQLAFVGGPQRASRRRSRWCR
jgi:2-haloacid dehalogenase